MCMAVGSGMPNGVAAFIDVCSTDVRDSSYSYSCGARGHKKLSNSNLRLHHTLVTDDLYKAYTLNPKPETLNPKAYTFYARMHIVIKPRQQSRALNPAVRSRLKWTTCMSRTPPIPKGSKYHYGIYLDPQNTL